MKGKDIQTIITALKQLRIIATEFGKYDKIKASIKAKREVKS